MKKRHQADDTPEMIEHRIAEYHRNASFVQERYSGAQLKKIDGSKSEDQVWRDVEKALAAQERRGTHLVPDFPNTAT